MAGTQSIFIYAPDQFMPVERKAITEHIDEAPFQVQSKLYSVLSAL